MSPVNRALIKALFVATLMAGGFTIWMKVQFGVPFSYVHWWLFGFVWLPSFYGALKGSTWREGLQYMDRGTSSDVLTRHKFER